QYFTFIDQLSGNKAHTVCLSLLGKHQISNALLVLALAKILAIEYPEFVDLSFNHLSGRSELVHIHSARFINDAYNANPESMRATIETFITLPHQRYKYLVLGEMKELGH